MANKYLSRKFIISILTFITASGLPMLYKHLGISDVITMTVLGLVSSVAVGYGLINVKDSNNELKAGVAIAEPKTPE